ncbi:MAG: hypothetical protein HYS23_12290 [Geobacter sp.]|nr:hypothetical protein [Geobacter sp.]
MKGNACFVLIALLVTTCIVFTKTGIAQSQNSSDNKIGSNANSARDYFNFKFVMSQSKNYILIESDLESWNYEIRRTLEERGLTVPTVQKIFRIKPKLLQKMVVNKSSDKYTVLSNYSNYAMATEGFYYNVDDGCGDDTITVKLAPEKAVVHDFSNEQIVVLKQPHPLIKKLNIVPYVETKIPEYFKNVLAKMLKDKFTQFLKNNEFYSEGVKTSEIKFFDLPAVTVYRPQNSTANQFVSAVWHSEKGEMQCCMAGLYQLDIENAQVRLDEVIPMNPDGKGVGGFEIDKFVYLNGRVFVFLNSGYWEWAEEVIYEIMPNSKSWKPYSQSRGTGGC